MALPSKQSSALQMINTGLLLAVLNYVVQVEHRLTALESQARPPTINKTIRNGVTTIHAQGLTPAARRAV